MEQEDSAGGAATCVAAADGSPLSLQPAAALPGGGECGPPPAPLTPPARTKPRLGAGGLPPKEKALVRLFAAACHRRWGELGALASTAAAAGASPAEVRATVRHLVVVSGYAHCLAATNALVAGGFLGPPTPGVIAGAAAPARPQAQAQVPPPAGPHPPAPASSSAFARVYGRAAPTVAARLHAADPVMAEWIRIHLYGDVYASPGLPLATKQLLMVAFLGDAGMPDQLFGHAVAALREGATASGLLDALDAGFQASPEPACPARTATYDAALDALEHAWSRARAEWEGGEGEGGGEDGGKAAVVTEWEGAASLPADLDVGAWGAVVGVEGRGP